MRAQSSTAIILSNKMRGTKNTEILNNTAKTIWQNLRDTNAFATVHASVEAFTAR